MVGPGHHLMLRRVERPVRFDQFPVTVGTVQAVPGSRRPPRVGAVGPSGDAVRVRPPAVARAAAGARATTTIPPTRTIRRSRSTGGARTRSPDSRASGYPRRWNGRPPPGASTGVCSPGATRSTYRSSTAPTPGADRSSDHLRGMAGGTRPRPAEGRTAARRRRLPRQPLAVRGQGDGRERVGAHWNRARGSERGRHLRRFLRQPLPRGAGLLQGHLPPPRRQQRRRFPMRQRTSHEYDATTRSHPPQSQPARRALPVASGSDASPTASPPAAGQPVAKAHTLSATTKRARPTPSTTPTSSQKASAPSAPANASASWPTRPPPTTPSTSSA